MTDVILYSTGCPRCSVLKRKLDEKGIAYTENNNVDEMLAMGIMEAPMLGVDGEVLNFSKAIGWVASQTGENAE